LVILIAVYFILLKLAVVVALALLFSCYTTPLLSILFTAGLYVSGLFVKEMRTIHNEMTSRALQVFLRWLSYILPNFQNFDVMGAAAHGRSIPGSLVLENTAYAALYCAIVLVLASAVFSRKNLK
jgi:ABC-type transport system involved in multi-copper enzyme maturation permease subunit